MSSAVPPRGSSAAPSPAPFVELANIYEQREEPRMRDRFLILAAAAAVAVGQPEEAERLLQRLLLASPHHMLKGYRTFAEAVRAEPVRVYISDLKQNYPPETVHNLLESLRGQTVPVETMKAPILPSDIPLLPEEPPAKESDWTALLNDVPTTPARPAEAARRPAKREEERPLEMKPLKSPPMPRLAPLAAAVPQPKPVPTKAKKPAATKESRRPTPKAPRTSWVATFLLVAVLLGGLALLGYTLARPLLP